MSAGDFSPLSFSLLDYSPHKLSISKSSYEDVEYFSMESNKCAYYGTLNRVFFNANEFLKPFQAFESVSSLNEQLRCSEALPLAGPGFFSFSVHVPGPGSVPHSQL